MKCVFVGKFNLYFKKKKKNIINQKKPKKEKRKKEKPLTVGATELGDSIDEAVVKVSGPAEAGLGIGG